MGGRNGRDLAVGEGGRPSGGHQPGPLPRIPARGRSIVGQHRKAPGDLVDEGAQAVAADPRRQPLDPQHELMPHRDGKTPTRTAILYSSTHRSYFLVLSTDESVESAAMKASCGTSTRPTIFIRFLPSFCFSSSLRLRVMSPP